MMQLLLRDLLVKEQGQTALIINKQAIEQFARTKNFNTGSIIHSLQAVEEAGKSYKK